MIPVRHPRAEIRWVNFQICTEFAQAAVRERNGTHTYGVPSRPPVLTPPSPDLRPRTSQGGRSRSRRRILSPTLRIISPTTRTCSTQNATTLKKSLGSAGQDVFPRESLPLPPPHEALALEGCPIWSGPSQALVVLLPPAREALPRMPHTRISKAGKR